MSRQSGKSRQTPTPKELKDFILKHLEQVEELQQYILDLDVHCFELLLALVAERLAKDDVLK